MDFSQYGEVPSNVQDAILQASNETGVSPDLLARIARQESGFQAGVYSPAGAAGLFQLMEGTAADLGVEDRLNPYQSASGGARYIAQNLKKYGGDVTKALAAYNAGPGNVDEWIANGWDGSVSGIPFEETRNYVANISGGQQENPYNIPTSYTQSGGNAPINLKSQFQLDDPNEKIDFDKVMGILKAPKQNVAMAGEDALRSQLSRQAHHTARGRLASPFYVESDKQLMQSAVARAQEEAKMNNQNVQLTGAGQLAKMIAESKNSSNAGLLASLGQMMGVKLDPMANRYMSQNEMAKMLTGFARQDKQLADERAFRMQEAEAQRAFQREMMNNKAAQAMALAEMKQASGGGGRGGGTASGSTIRSSDKYVQGLAEDFGDYLAENSEKEVFTQGDVNELTRRYNDLALQLASAEDSPYAREVLRKIQNDYAYQINHIQTTVSGNGLDYGPSDAVKARYANTQQ